jgi:hypothetical protein
VTSVFTYTGGEQTFVVPEGVHSIHVRADGAPGGEGTPMALRSTGMVIFADVPVTPGETSRQRAGAKPCTRLIPVGASFTHADHRGANRAHFSGRVKVAGKTRRLAPGSYRLRASLRSAVATGRSVSVAFRIVR